MVGLAKEIHTIVKPRSSEWAVPAGPKLADGRACRQPDRLRK